jgi:outer membrane lipoprotein-sorting protein
MFPVPCSLILVTCSLCAVAAPTPEEDPRAALIRMGEAVEALHSYEATIHRTTEVDVSGERETTETAAHLAIERPNRVLFEREGPDGAMRVVCDGARLVVSAEAAGTLLDMPAPVTLAEIDRETGGLAAEGLALGGLFFAEEPVERLIADFGAIHDLGTTEVESRRARLVGLEDRDTLRMILYLDPETWLPFQATLDASSTLRDILTAQNINSRGARVTVTERHEDVRLNPRGLEFPVTALARSALVSPER